MCGPQSYNVIIIIICVWALRITQSYHYYFLLSPILTLRVLPEYFHFYLMGPFPFLRPFCPNILLDFSLWWNLPLLYLSSKGVSIYSFWAAYPCTFQIIIDFLDPLDVLKLACIYKNFISQSIRYIMTFSLFFYMVNKIVIIVH